MPAVNQEVLEKAGLFPTATVYQLSLVGSMAASTEKGKHIPLDGGNPKPPSSEGDRVDWSEIMDTFNVQT